MFDTLLDLVAHLGIKLRLMGQWTDVGSHFCNLCTMCISYPRKKWPFFQNHSRYILKLASWTLQIRFGYEKKRYLVGIHSHKYPFHMMEWAWKLKLACDSERNATCIGPESIVSACIDSQQDQYRTFWLWGLNDHYRKQHLRQGSSRNQWLKSRKKCIEQANFHTRIFDGGDVEIRYTLRCGTRI